MNVTREHTLPEDRNPMLDEERAPQHEILVERRCLGQTELKVKPGQIGTSNATKPDNLGFLDYAHLRVPLPKDLSSSGIFSRGTNRKWPEAYFLMRRSNDGFISATGMFKAAFPYAQQEEELQEKEYIKSLDSTSSEEVAGNVWIHPETALELAEEYGITLWINALLDPEPITHGTSPVKEIRSPPAFKNMPNGTGRSPVKKTAAATEGRSSTRGRRSASVRSDEPEIDTAPKTPGRPKATPRKPRKGRGTLSKVDEDASVEPELLNGVPGKLESVRETVKVEVETTTNPTDRGEEIERTKVNVEMPTGHPELPLPDNTQEMLETARKMVAEAQKVAGPSTGRGKRKAEEMIEDDDEVELGPSLPAKRARKIEVELRKEKIKRRAVTGIAAGILIGSLIPGIMAAFGS